MDAKLVGKRIQEARKERRMTQSELAEKTGRAFNTIGDVERGNTIAGWDILVDIANALDWSVDDFLVDVLHKKYTVYFPQFAERIKKLSKKYLELLNRMIMAFLNM